MNIAIRFLVSAALAAIAADGALATPVCKLALDTPRTITAGIIYQKAGMDCPTDDMGSPRTLTSAHIVEVNLGTPGLSVHASTPGSTPVPSAANVGQLFQVALPTSVFAVDARPPIRSSSIPVRQIAINANLFTNCCTDYDDTQVTLLRGLEIEQSAVNTPALANLDCTIPSATFASSLLIDRNATASIWTAKKKNDLPNATTVTAVTGSHQIVENATNIAPACPGKQPQSCGSWLGLNARTGVGLKNDTTLFLVVVDGKDGGNGGAAGATLYQLADVMMQFGVVAAINLDGGGSSTMAQRDIGPNGPAWVLSDLTDNSSGGDCTVKGANGCERYVGTTLYVEAP